MRADMAKVIVERPRIGSGQRGHAKGASRRRRQLGLDGLRREGIKRPYDSTKPLNEHLSPLNRYLDRQVGRPWDKVFAEICAHVRRDSAVQDHVRDHVEDFVAVHVVLIDGVLCHGGGGRFGRRYGTPLCNRGRRRSFYVCPRTGLLRRVPQDEGKQQRDARRGAPAPATPIVPFGKDRQLRLVGGQWCEVFLSPFPTTEYGPLTAAHDVLLGRSLGADEAVGVYGRRAYAVRVRRLGRKELHSLPIPVDLLRRPRTLPEVVR